jgi:hypothetical protein
LFDLKTIFPSRPAIDLRCRAQAPSKLPEAPGGLGLYCDEHGGILACGGMQELVLHIKKSCKIPITGLVGHGFGAQDLGSFAG